jgi:hypothetical protein
VQNKHIFFLPDQMMNVVNIHIKFNFLHFFYIFQGNSLNK